MRRFHCSTVKITLLQFTGLVPAQFECSPSVVDCQDSSVVAVPSYSSSSVQLQWIVNLAVSWIPLYAPLYAASTSCVTKSQRLFSDIFTFSFHNILSDSFNGYISTRIYSNCETQRFTDQKLNSTIFPCCCFCYFLQKRQTKKDNIIFTHEKKENMPNKINTNFTFKF